MVVSFARNAVARVSCGVVARSLRTVVVDPTRVPGIARRVGGGDLVARRQRRPGLLAAAGAGWSSGAHLSSRLPTREPGDGVDPRRRLAAAGDPGCSSTGSCALTSSRIVDLPEDRRPRGVPARTSRPPSPTPPRWCAAVTSRLPPAPLPWRREPGDHRRNTTTARSDPAGALDAVRAAVSQRHGLTTSRYRIPTRRRRPSDHQRQTRPAGVARAADYLGGSLKGSSSGSSVRLPVPQHQRRPVRQPAPRFPHRDGGLVRSASPQVERTRADRACSVQSPSRWRLVDHCGGRASGLTVRSIPPCRMPARANARSTSPLAMRPATSPSAPTDRFVLGDFGARHGFPRSGLVAQGAGRRQDLLRFPFLSQYWHPTTWAAGPAERSVGEGSNWTFERQAVRGTQLEGFPLRWWWGAGP